MKYIMMSKFTDNFKGHSKYSNNYLLFINNNKT